MNRSIAAQLAPILLAGALTSATAGVAHKWVDADGITHYSDAPPAIETSPVTLIELAVSDTPANDPAAAYYSIRNQWLRIQEERLARERIRLEQIRLKSQTPSAAPQVITLHAVETRPYGLQQPRFRPRLYHKARHHAHRGYRHFRGGPGKFKPRHRRAGGFWPTY